jgi:hypothetical protein
LISAEPEQDRGLFPNAWLIPALATLGLAGIVQVIQRPLNGDAAWYLYMGGRVLDGARAYVDIVDTNPPLIVWLSIAVVAGSRALGLVPLVAFPSLLLALTGLSLGLAWRLSRALPTALRQVSLLAWAYLLWDGVGSGFGQREHLMLILTLPYVFGATNVARGQHLPRGLAIVTGVMAGVGFGLKPFFVLAPIAVELYLAICRRVAVWKRLQALAMLGTLLVYGVAILGFTPEYLDVARRFAAIYPHFNPLGSTLWPSSWRLLLVGGAVTASSVVAWSSARGWAGVFGALALGLTGAVYLTGKGWVYHWFPPVAVSVALLAGAGGMVAARFSLLGGRRMAAPLMALIVLLLAVDTVADPLSRIRGDREVLRFVQARTRPGDGMLILSCWLHKSFPLVNESGTVWGMRYPMILHVPAFYADGSWARGGYHTLAAMGGPERRYVDEVASDFVRTHPAVLLIDDDPPDPNLTGFDYLVYFAQEPQFARELAGYEYVARLSHARAYVRRDRSISSREKL